MKTLGSLRRGLIALSLPLAVAATAAGASGQAAPPAIAALADPAVANYRMTTTDLQKFNAATRALQVLKSEGLDLDGRIQDPDQMDLPRLAAVFDGEPRVKAAINDAGMTSTQYLVFLFSMMQTMFGAVAVEMGGEQALNDMPDGALKDNVRFFMAHRAEFEAMRESGSAPR